MWGGLQPAVSALMPRRLLCRLESTPALPASIFAGWRWSMRRGRRSPLLIQPFVGRPPKAALALPRPASSPRVAACPGLAHVGRPPPCGAASQGRARAPKPRLLWPRPAIRGCQRQIEMSACLPSRNVRFWGWGVRSRVSLDSIRREVAFLAGLRGRSDGLAPKQTPFLPALRGILMLSESVRCPAFP